MSGWLNYLAAVGRRVHIDRAFVRDARQVLGQRRRSRRLRPEPNGRKIAFYPHPAGPWYTLRMAVDRSPLRITRDLSEADIVAVFDDRTVSERPQILTGARRINGEALDISKRHVGAIFDRVFGYPISVDPLSHVGDMVEKSDENGVHDGRIVTGPLERARPGHIYQRLVNSVVDGAAEDLRCVWVLGKIALVYHKRKALDQRFSTTYLGTIVRRADDVFSDEEIQTISEFCRKMGLDFGSLDVMRDQDDGRIYIVDVNKTCMPVLSLSPEALEEAITVISDALMRGLER